MSQRYASQRRGGTHKETFNLLSADWRYTLNTESWLQYQCQPPNITKVEHLIVQIKYSDIKSTVWVWGCLKVKKQSLMQRSSCEHESEVWAATLINIDFKLKQTLKRGFYRPHRFNRSQFNSRHLSVQHWKLSRGGHRQHCYCYCITSCSQMSQEGATGKTSFTFTYSNKSSSGDICMELHSVTFNVCRSCSDHLRNNP